LPFAANRKKSSSFLNDKRKKEADMKNAILLIAALAPFFIGSDCYGPDPPVDYSSQVAINNPGPMTVSGQVEFTFEISCKKQRWTSVVVLFSDDSGSTWSSATIVSANAGTIQGNIIKDLTAGQQVSVVSFVWDSVTDLGYEYVTGIKLLVFVEETDVSWDYWHLPFYNYYSYEQVTKTFNVNNNRVPVVTISTPEGEQAGDVVGEFFLSDNDSDLCRATIEYSKDNGAHYYAATLKSAGSNPMSGNLIFGLDSGASPRRYVFVWDSLADLGEDYLETVMLSVVANDGLEDSQPAYTNAFTVANNAAPYTEIADVDAVQSGDVRIDFSAGDDDSPVLTLFFEFSVDGGISWENAALRHSSAGAVSGSEISITDEVPGSLDGWCVWDSVADGVALDDIVMNVRIRVTPQDEKRRGSTSSTRGFIADNTFAGSWGAPAVVSGSYAACGKPCASFDATGKPFVVFADDSSAQSKIYIARYSGTAWNAPAVVASSGGTLSNPRACVTANGYIHFAFVENSSVMYEFYNGSAYSARVKLSGSGEAYSPAIAAASSGDVYAVFREYSGGRNTIFSVTISGGTPSAAEEISAGAEDASSPSVACVSNTPHVAWCDYVSGSWRVYHSSKSGAWSTPEIASGNATDARTAQIAADSGGEVAVAYMNTASPAAGIYVNVLGGSWGTPVLMSSGLGSAVEPDVVYHTGRPRTVWSDNGGAARSYDVSYASLLSGGAGAPASMSNTEDDSMSPSLAGSASGKQALAWLEMTSSGTVIMCRIK
jgi:hypothetical protein